LANALYGVYLPYKVKELKSFTCFSPRF